MYLPILFIIFSLYYIYTNYVPNTIILYIFQLMGSISHSAFQYISFAIDSITFTSNVF